MIVGTVYNADQMPPYLGKGPDGKHPEDEPPHRLQVELLAGRQRLNEMRFFDAQGKEQMFLHAERNMDTRVKNDSMERVVGNRHLIVGNTGGDLGPRIKAGINTRKSSRISISTSNKITTKRSIKTCNSPPTQDIQITGQKTETLKSGSDLHVTSNRREQIDGNDNLNVGGNLAEQIEAARTT